MKQATHHLPGIFDVSPTITKNRLIYGDNLTIMRTMPNACVDLIYLDPPFNSQRNYNIIYKKLTGQPVPEQEEAFCDAWEMDAEKEEMARKMPIVLRDYGVDEDIVLFWKAWIDALRHTQPELLAYLVYMTYRLFDMKRILKPTGSIYLHCDPTASHYIKVVMDGVFGHQNFRNEIIWQRTNVHNAAKQYGRIHDVLLFYTKGTNYTWNKMAMPYSHAQTKRYKKGKDGRLYTGQDLTASRPNSDSGRFEWRGTMPSTGRGWGYTIEQLEEWWANGKILIKQDGTPRMDGLKVYLDEMPGKPPQSIWTDISRIANTSSERLGYPTQKPIALLQRIVQVSSNEGDVIFDPFCGCGTAVYAAHLLGRKWIGCDIAILSVRLIRDVLLKRYGLTENKDYEISGIPLSVEGAEELFDHDPHQFQHWAVELAGGFSSTKTTGDKGIDGRIHFEVKKKLNNMVLSVKGGKLSPAFMRELRGTFEREQSDTKMGGLICLQQPTKGMREEAASAGIYTVLGKDYDKLQIRTIQELFDGKGFDTPSRVETLGWQNQIVMPI
jgi:DNA modification methylase